MCSRGRQPLDKVFIISDIHVPYHDARAWAAAEEVCRDLKPHKIIINGDFLDFVELSRFERDPRRKHHLQDEIDLGAEMLAQVQSWSPRAKCIFIEGNHEDRLRRWLWQHPDISSLRGLDLRGLLGLDALGWAHVPYKSRLTLAPGVIVEHGDISRIRGGYTAQGMLDRRWTSGVSGHTHRLAMIHRTTEAGAAWWIEGGCLCRLRAPWLSGQPDWQHGCVTGWQTRGGKLRLQPVPIDDGVPACMLG